MTKQEIKNAISSIIENTSSAGVNDTLTEVQLDAVTDAIAEGLNTVNPTKEYPPVKL